MEITQTGWDSQAQGAQTSKSQLGKQDFMRLLISQIQNQDPLNPQDSSAFVAQLAQFSGLEQMVQMNQRLDSLAVSSSASTGTAVASLIGKTVQAQGDQIDLGEQGDVELNFALPVDATDLELTITDESGRVVRTMSLGQRDSGENSITWNGCDDDGNRLPAGTYTFQVKGSDEEGQEVSATGRITGVITGISYDKGYPELLMGDRRISMGDVIEIS